MEAINVGIGSVFEQSIRYLMLMYTTGEPMSEDRISCLDFIATYAGDFGFDEKNLHGNSGYRFGEFASRAFNAKKALLDLAQRSLVHIEPTKQGCTYEITEDGTNFINELNSSYVGMYLDIADRVNFRFIKTSTKTLHDNILQRIGNSVKDVENYE